MQIVKAKEKTAALTSDLENNMVSFCDKSNHVV